MDLLDVILGLIGVNKIAQAVHSKPAHLCILPLGDQDQDGNWLIRFSVGNFTERDIAIAPIVTATFKTGVGESDAAFVISGADATIPAMTRKVFSALASNRNLKPPSPYSLHQIHVTPLAMAE